MSDAIAQRAAALLDRRLDDWERAHGGDLSSVLRLNFSGGETAIAKTGPAPAAEARMLRAIAAAGAPAPAVLAADESVLVIEDLPDDGALAGLAWESLGSAVRALHDATGDAYGWEADFAFGPVAIPNGRTDDWPSFWAKRRLLSAASEAPSDIRRRVEDLSARLADLLPARPAPSLLHGDLWTGNVLVSNGRVTGLIDPACAYGHAEADLAMLRLFGSPGEGFWRRYGAVEPGMEERLPVYQLWPALVHLRLFGASYRGLVERLLSAVSA